MKKVLVIAYSFPPAGGGRVSRVLKFVKFLPEFGWKPFVLTVKKPVVTEYDEGLLSEISSSAKVIRTYSWEPSRKWKTLIKDEKTTKSFIKGGFNRVLKDIFRRAGYFLFLPDSRVGWIPFCIFAGYRIIRKEKIDLIFVSAEPFSSFISAAILKILTKKPLIVDFRDEWVGFSDYYFPDKPKIVKKVEMVLERLVIRNADKVVSVTNPIIENFINRYPEEKKEKFACITNGFDPDDFKDVSPPVSNAKFTITYTGALYKLRSPEFFLEAAGVVSRKEPEFLQEARIRFAGSLDSYTSNVIRNSSLHGIIQIDGFLSHREALAAMTGSDLLLFIEDQVPISRCLLPAKLFEYMAVGRPVFALANPGSVKEIIEYTSCGRVAASLDIQAIAKTLCDFYYSFKEKRKLCCEANYNRIMDFSRRNTTQRLGNILDECLDETG